MKFKIKFLYGLKILGEVEGLRDVNENEITMEYIQKVLDTEKFIEKLTGLRVHIDYTNGGK